MTSVRTLSAVEGYEAMAYMYMLECADGSYYTGSTKHLRLRLRQHTQGTGARYTSKRLPVKLAYLEYYKRVAEAYAREKQIQRWNSSKKHSLVTGAYRDLRAAAACRNISHFKFRNLREI